MDYTETNKLIAEFMGDETLYIQIDYCTDMAFPYDDLHFHESWDWLMPVVKKCLDIYHIEQKNDDLNFPFYDCMGDIDRTYKLVVEFIKFYNQNK